MINHAESFCRRTGSVWEFRGRRMALIGVTRWIERSVYPYLALVVGLGSTQLGDVARQTRALSVR